MEHNCHFICVNNFFGNKYGTPKKEVERAIESVDEYWVLDFSITKKHLLDNYHHVSFVILPENEEQLVNNIIKSNRLDRLDYILEEFKHNYIKYYKLASNESSNIIINIHSEINKTSKIIHSIVENLKHEYFK